MSPSIVDEANYSCSIAATSPSGRYALDTLWLSFIALNTSFSVKGKIGKVRSKGEAVGRSLQQNNGLPANH